MVREPTCCPQLATAAGGPAFIVLSTFQTPQYVAAAVALGASGFVAKTAPTAGDRRGGPGRRRRGNGITA